MSSRGLEPSQHAGALRNWLRSALASVDQPTITRADLDEIQSLIGHALIALADLSAALEGPGVRAP